MKINPVNPRINLLEPIENSYYKPFKNLVEITEIIGKNKFGEIVVFSFDSSESQGNYLESRFKFVEKGDLSSEKTSDFTLEEFNQLNEKFEFQVYANVFRLDLFGEKKRNSKGKLSDYTEIQIGNPFTVEFNQTN